LLTRGGAEFLTGRIVVPDLSGGRPQWLIGRRFDDNLPGDAPVQTPSVARKVGLPAEQVFKTLLCRGDRHGVCFAVVPGDAQLDFKALARLSGDRSVEIVPLKEVQPLTGYIRGGVTVLGARKEYPAFADETIELFDLISFSSGTRGTHLLLSPADYLRATRARVGPIALAAGS